MSMPGSPDHPRAARCREEKEKAKAKVKEDPKGPEDSLAMNKHKILNGQKRTLLGGPEERKACQKAMMAFRRVVFALTSQIEAQARIKPRTKARDRTKREEARKGAFPQSGLSASETPNEEGYGHAWEPDD